MAKTQAKSSLSIRLKRRAIAWAGQLTKLARMYAPDHLRPYIHTNVEESKGQDQFILRLGINPRANPQEKGGTLDARAQEYGSGLRARRGSKTKYPITPKTRKILAFQWDVADNNPEYFSFLPDGRVILPKVMHPGIEAANEGKGYLAPAIKALKIRQELKKEIDDAISFDIRTSFSGAKKRQ